METPRRLKASVAGVAAWAGRSEDGKKVAVLLSNLDGAEGELEVAVAKLPWIGRTRCITRDMDSTHDLNAPTTFETTAGDIRLTQPLPSKMVRLIELSPL